MQGGRGVAWGKENTQNRENERQGRKKDKHAEKTTAFPKLSLPLNFPITQFNSQYPPNLALTDCKCFCCVKQIDWPLVSVTIAIKQEGLL